MLLETNSKREAYTKATGHMTQYKHDTWVRDRVAQPD